MLEYDWEYEVQEEEEVEPITNTVTKVWISLISVDYITYIYRVYSYALTRDSF